MLIIHPYDRSTEFLCPIYKGLDCEVIKNGLIAKVTLRRKIMLADKVVFLGHGTEKGLLRTPIDGSYLVDSSFAQALRGKECVYVWCHADKFVQKYGLSGFATGMFISEPNEALVYGVPFSMESIQESNNAFAASLGVTKSKEGILEGVKNYPANSSVAAFNKQKFYIQ